MNKILIVDDEPHIVKLLERFLTLKGFKTQGVGDGAKALEIIKSAAEINLIIIDMKMPGVSGISVLKEMHAMNKDIPVIILSGCPVAEGGDYDDLKSTGYNPDEVLCKPMDLFALLDIINKKIARKN
jgi:DNA-binding response OmpR family regulator